jgi:hypothetical protein
MNYKLTYRSFLLLLLLLSLGRMALASTTWYVNGVTGSDSNNCLSSLTACKTIGHAISLASSGDTVMVAAATYKENLTIGISLKIFGSNASTTFVDGGGRARVVTISSASARVTLSELTIQNGFVTGMNPDGGGVSNVGTLTINNSTVTGNSAQSGGGIDNLNGGRLAINNSTINGNKVSGSHGCFIFCAGGGIFNAGTLTINDNTISANNAVSAAGAAGSGIFNSGTLTISNTTLSGNSVAVRCGRFSSCRASGGGIYSIGTLTISNTTLSGNSASASCYIGARCVASGGGISGTATVQNSIVANNPSGGNCNGTMTSNGYNLSSDSTCNFNGPGDLNNTYPLLGPLQNNGGPTKTMALLPGSPAIDAGNPSGCTDGHGHLLTTDQRGYPRHDREDTGGCDMGAFERQSD